MPQRLIAFAAIVLAACGSEIAGKRTLDLAPCRLPNLATSAQCGSIEVPEDRSKPGGRKIAIFAAVLPANTLSPAEDPLVILAGGPGQAASTLAPFAARLAEVRRRRDVVLIDQRGTGRSSPLVCEAFKPRANEVFDTDPLPRAKACVEELQGKGVDLAQYTTTAFIADLEDMREALGYARWNLWGGSYGTRVAQEYLRRHGGRVRTMVLDGVAPPGLVIPLDVWRTREETLAAIVKACAASPACAAAHPDVAGTLGRIGDALGEGKEMDVVDPRTGSTVRARVTFDVVLSALQPLTYAPETAILLPELIALAAAGDLTPLFAANPQASTRESDQVNAALHFSVTCAEDAPRITPPMKETALGGLPTRDLALRTIAVCDIWPRGSVPADFGQPVKSDVPTLIFSGGLDPVTPPAYGKQVQDDLRVSRHVVAPGYGHIVSFHACGPRLVAAFVAAAGFAKLSDACIRHFETSVVPPLFVNRLGATP